MRTLNGKTGSRLSAKLRGDRALNGGLRVDLGANFALGLLSEKNVIGTAMVKVNGDVVSINDYYLTDILGFTREEFERDGLNLLELTPGEDLDVDKMRAEYKETGKIRAFERPRYRKDGSIVWTLVGYAGVEGNPELLSSWTLDITDKKRAEVTSQYLLEANKIMASSVEMQPLLEKIASVTLVNGFCDFCTIHFPEGDDRLTCRALIHKDPELTKQVRRVIERYPRYLSDAIGPARVIRTGKSEMSSRTDAGDPRNYRNEHHFHSVRALALKSYMSVPLFFNGQTIGALTLTSMSRHFEPEDLKTAEALALRASQHIENAKLHEELKQSSRDLERSNRDLTYFASIAAHDLKSPLATSQSYLNLILDEIGGALSSEHREWLTRAIDINRKLLSQVDRLLTFSHAEHSAVLKTEIGLEEVVRSVIDGLGRQIERAGARFAFENLPTVKGDPTLLSVLFQNLFANSIRYRGDRPLIVSVSATPLEQGGWTIHVKDNGIGFDSDGAERIFRLFERLPSAEEPRSASGQGIGLATCRKIIEAHNGRIWADSAPNEGAQFSFTLPG